MFNAKLALEAALEPNQNLLKIDPLHDIHSWHYIIGIWDKYVVPLPTL